MEHSIEKYLERRTDQELEMMLAIYLQEEGKYYDMLTNMIRAIQQERKLEQGQ